MRICLVFISCILYIQTACTQNKLKNITYLKALSSFEEFQHFSSLPLVSKYGQVSGVKVVYDVESNTSYFLNAKFYKYHYDFCQKELGEMRELQSFIDAYYSADPDKQYLLANVNFIPDIDQYVIEISHIDLMSVKQIHKMTDAIIQQAYFKGKVKFLTNSQHLMDYSTEIATKIPTIQPADIYENLSYQGISEYETYGQLKFVEDLDAVFDELSYEDIIVLNKTPEQLPDVAGIIVSVFQTPLSHLTILGRNRKIPIAAYKNAFDDPNLLALTDQQVKLEVKTDTFYLEKTSKRKSPNKYREAKKLKYALDLVSLTSMSALKLRDSKRVGNKAANFAVLEQTGKDYGFKTPEGAFAIPFYCYDQHITQAGIQSMIITLLNDETLRANKDSVKAHLKRIRTAIHQQPIDPVLLVAVEGKMRQGGYERMRFRSSTNAEDAEGFSGAGLYASKTGVLGDPKKSVERAIETVWASLWSYQAFMEREYFRIDQSTVYMGVLVHRSFPNEAANGVAITKNLYRPDNYGFVLNVQLGEESVVKPKIGQVCDQLICYPTTADEVYKYRNSMDIITTSNLNNGEMVLSKAEIQNLADLLDVIKKVFYNKERVIDPFLEYALDVEFKVDGVNRDIYIKQVRRYND